MVSNADVMSHPFSNPFGQASISRAAESKSGEVTSNPTQSSREFESEWKNNSFDNLNNSGRQRALAQFPDVPSEVQDRGAVLGDVTTTEDALLLRYGVNDSSLLPQLESVGQLGTSRLDGRQVKQCPAQNHQMTNCDRFTSKGLRDLIPVDGKR